MPTMIRLAWPALAGLICALGCSNPVDKGTNAPTTLPPNPVVSEVPAVFTPPSVPSCDSLAGPNAIKIPLFPEGSALRGVTSPNFQKLDAQVTLPFGQYAHIEACYRLKTFCTGKRQPDGTWPAQCDPFDRNTWLVLKDEGATPVFLVDAITPFGGGAMWHQDITDYAILLQGTHTYEVMIPFWADPKGRSVGTDAQFGVEAMLIVTPGKPPRDVVDVVPALFSTGFTPKSEPLTALVVPGRIGEHVRLDFYTSGGGLTGPDEECDEFCQKANRLTVDDVEVYNEAPWLDCSDNCQQVPGKSSCRTDDGWVMRYNYICANNPTSCPVSPVFPRSNWCPSKQVGLKSFELDPRFVGGMHQVSLAVKDILGQWFIGAVMVYYR